MNLSQQQNQPIIILYAAQQDGDYFALLLSNHFIPKGSSNNGHQRLSVHENYYTNAAIQQCCLSENKGTQRSAQLRLLLDEGYDTQKLHGLLLPLHLLPELNIHAHFDNALWLILQNDFVSAFNPSDTKSALLQLPEARCRIIQHGLLNAAPEQLLQQLHLFHQGTLVDTDSISPHTYFPDEWLQKAVIQKPSLADIPFPHLLSCANQQTDRNSLLVFFTSVCHEQHLLIIQRLKALYCSISGIPRIHIHSKSIEDQDKLQKLLAPHSLFYSDIRWHTNPSGAVLINSIIAQSSFTWIWIDDMMLQFNPYRLLCEQQTQLSFHIVHHQYIQDRISLAHLLFRHFPEHNLLFHRNVWEAVGDFDETLPGISYIWDYAIRYAVQTKQEASICDATLWYPKDILNETETSAVTKQVFDQILQKHSQYLNAALQEGISHSVLSHLEMTALQQQLARLTWKSRFTGQEVNALHELNTQLQQRIQYLENNWYQQVRIRVNRLRKIFFKKKSPGAGNLKRILQFIRFALSKAGFGIARKVMANGFKRLFLWTERRPVEIVYKDIESTTGIYTYHDWITHKLKKEDIQIEAERCMPQWTNLPLVSIIMPVYNTPLTYLREAIESVISQVYPNWELCIADDHSTEKKVAKLLRGYQAKDKRIKVCYRSENGHISQTSNDALKLASGSFVLLMDHDDLLTINCLFEFVATLQTCPDADILYSDEDKIDAYGIHQQAHFKPRWSPDHLLSRNYIGHALMIRKSLMDQIGGFRLGFEGSQDYDLLLRATEQTTSIVHIPKVLYHWRIHQLSAAQGEDVKPYAYIAAKKALEETLQRRNLTSKVRYLAGLRGYRIDYDLQRADDMVSIIIPTKDQVALLKNTIDTLIEKTQYAHYEIIVLNNNSTSTEFTQWAQSYTQTYGHCLRVIDASFPFNFARLMNIGASLAKGKHLLLLNNDVEIIQPDWLDIMLSYAQQSRIGAVGVRLLYPDDTIQHAGVIIGLGGIAGHAFTGSYKDEPGYFNYIQSVNNYSAVTAACLLCRKEVFDEVQGMDEQFEVEYNDVDFCLKLMKAGYYNVYIPHVELYHYESATRGHPHQSKVSYERHLHEMSLFKKKWQDIIDDDPHYNPNLNRGVHDFGINFEA
jgi:O-antigen biosynthesis protein